MARGKSNTKVLNSKEFEEALKRLGDLSGNWVTIGIHKEDSKRQQVRVGPQKTKPADDKTPNLAEIGWWNEYGTATSPPRPWLRETIRENRKRISRKLLKELRRHLENRQNLRKTYERLGEFEVQLVTDKILYMTTPSNRPATVAKKGFNDPLVDLGELVMAVGYRVRLRGGKMPREGSR